MKCDFLIQKKK